MNSLVRCTYCGVMYDEMGVKVIARYADCTLYETPCCKRTTDDRFTIRVPEHREDHNVVLLRD